MTTTSNCIHCGTSNEEEAIDSFKEKHQKLWYEHNTYFLETLKVKCSDCKKTTQLSNYILTNQGETGGEMKFALKTVDEPPTVLETCKTVGSTILSIVSICCILGFSGAATKYFYNSYDYNINQ